MKLFLPRIVYAFIICGSLFGAAPESSPLDNIPGSAVMPPKVSDSPLPPPMAKQSGGAKLGVWIKADGSVDTVEVIGASNEWRGPASEAVKRWRFEPVQWEGKPIPARTEVELTQVSPKDIRWTTSPLPNLPGEIHTEGEFGLTNPVIKDDPDVVLPLIVQATGRKIEVVLNYRVLDDGSTDKIAMKGATSEGAVRAALNIISERTYEPAKVRDQAVVFQCRQGLAFSPLGPPRAELRGALDLVDPVYPFEQVLAQEDGSATVRLTLDEKGVVKATELVEATHPNFGAALIAAAESWSFSPEAAVEKGVREFKYDFVLANVSRAASRFVAMARDGKKVSSTAAGLDAKPKLLARPGLTYPTALFAQAVSGSAQVEFVIDRVGLAQAPRVVKATDPAFGWAAATMVNGMRFESLTRGGKPTELRVVMPITFEPPKKGSAAP